MKKKYLHIFLMFLLLLSFSIVSYKNDKITVEDLKKFAPVETYTNDTFLENVKIKRAIIFVAHDDDDCIMSGTISKLSSQGWEIRKLCFEIHEGKKNISDPSKIICNGSEYLVEDNYFRKNIDSLNKKIILPLNIIDSIFLTDKVAKNIIDNVSKFKPSVIFTLDSDKGGYGHCEHVFISRLVENLFKKYKIEVEKVYQAVYTRHMETEILDKWLGENLIKWGFNNVSLEANKILNIKGMPEPNVQINIENFAETKMKYLTSYKEDVLRNFRKFIPYFEDFDAKTYFGVFNREFFRIIEK